MREPVRDFSIPSLNALKSTRPWHWLTILSLDAPIVSLVWQDFFARLFHVELSAVSRAVLGLSVWLAYVADRWLDGRQLPAGGAVTARHAFAQRFSHPIATAWILVLAGTVLLAMTGLDRREIVAGLALAAAVFGYLGGCHRRGLRNRIGWLKEIAVSVLVSGGAAIFVLAPGPTIIGVHWVATGCLVLLCLLNCMAVSVWERAIDERQAQPSLARHFELQSGHLRGFALVVLAATGALALFAEESVLQRVALAAVFTTFGALGLIERGAWLDLDTRRLLADATLLSPLLFLPFS